MHTQKRVIAVAVAELLTPATHPHISRSTYGWLVRSCPYCGGVHIHCAGDDPLRVTDFLGYRHPDCATDDPGKLYFLNWSEVKP